MLTARILFEGARAIGIEALNNQERVTIKARKEVILSAGAIGSPQILMLSGIGPGSHLADHGINVLRNSVGVGKKGSGKRGRHS